VKGLSKKEVARQKLLATLRNQNTGLSRIRGGVTFSGCRASSYRVWIKVGVQSFRLEFDGETKPEAEWMRDMLAEAMLNLIELHRKP